MSAEQIYRNFRDGAGGTGLEQAAAIVRELAEAYERRADSITRLTGRMESVWQGDAAGAAQRGAGPLAVEHALAAPDMTTAQDLTSRQVGSFDHARNSVVPVPPMPDKPSPWENLRTLGGANDTYEDKLGEHNAAAEHNVAVMRGYADASDHNTGAIPTSYGSLLADEASVAVAAPATSDGRVGGFLNESTESRSPGDDSRPRGADTDQTVTPSYTDSPSTVTPAPGATAPSSHTPTPGTGPSPHQPAGPGGGTAAGFVPGAGQRPDGGAAAKPRPGSGPGGGRPPGSAAPGEGRGAAGGPPQGIRTPDSGRGTGTGGPGARGGFGPGPIGDDGARVGGPRAGVAPLPTAGGTENTASRGAAVNRGGTGVGVGGMGAASGRPPGGEDAEHERAPFLLARDPHELFGTDEITAPPVIGA
ncbi:hypothetical protein [Actinokineospora sp.]|uniref:hypothetical protein n=1 Tax=Actinokineospora sp. TaxID=1872133 RepID=UPI0040380738